MVIVYFGSVFSAIDRFNDWNESDRRRSIRNIMCDFCAAKICEWNFEHVFPVTLEPDLTVSHVQSDLPSKYCPCVHIAQAEWPALHLYVVGRGPVLQNSFDETKINSIHSITLYNLYSFLIHFQVLGIICMSLASPAYIASTHWFLFVVVTAFIATILWICVYFLGVREVLNLSINWILTVIHFQKQINTIFMSRSARISSYVFRNAQF